MAGCEICGSNSDTLTKVKIDLAVFRACEKCKHHGTIISEPEKPKVISVKKVQEIVKQEAPIKADVPVKSSTGEWIVVPDCAKIVSSSRQRLGLKQEELAMKINESLSLVRAVETGKLPDLKLARKLEKFFNTKLLELTQ